jgi:hypothetical protein
MTTYGFEWTENVLRDGTLVEYKDQFAKPGAPMVKCDSSTSYPPGVPRDMILHLNDVFSGRRVVGVEIGVLYGCNAISMLNILNLTMLYLVDPYLPTPDPRRPRPSPPHSKWPPWIFNACRLATYNLAYYSDRIHWLFMKSADASNFVNEALDFVYIDGDHSTPSVKLDIETWYPRVIPGGYIGGHDYFDAHMSKCPPVATAVDQFVEEEELELNVTTIKGQCDWWVRKP